MPFESLPGFRDFYPERCAVRNFLFRQWRRKAVDFGFLEYDAPILEPLELFTEKSGPEIVSQLFNFEDKGGRAVALRPELTPSLARLVGAKAGSIRRPVKWFSIGECFRYEKPQKGRTRSFYQLNADILGEPGAGADAELIALCVECLAVLGLGPEQIVVRLSDRRLWMELLTTFGVTGEAAPQVLGVVDKIERNSPEKTRELLQPRLGDQADDFLAAVEIMRGIQSLDALETWAAQIGSESLEARLADWRELDSRLKALGVDAFCKVDLGIVRGLAYYTGFVFEVFERSGKGRALAGGGRYDELVAKLGYGQMDACGFAIGDVTVTDLLEETGLMPPLVQAVDCYVVVGDGESERSAALGVVAAARRVGVSVDYPLKQQGFGKMFKAANQSGARLALIFGEEEVRDGKFKMKDMRTGGEATASLGNAADTIRMRLEAGIDV